MKKMIALLLVLVMAVSMVACGENPDTNPSTQGTQGSEPTSQPTEPTSQPTEPTSQPTEPQIQLPASALEMLENIWNAWEFEYKDYFMGGGYTNMVSGVPGTVETTDTDALQYLFYIPEANLADVQSAASALHGMNANVFTSAVFQVSDAAAFAATMQETLLNTQFVCGSPAHLLVYTLGNEYVLYAFGDTENLDSFRTAVTTAYADAVSVFDGAMG